MNILTTLQNATTDLTTKVSGLVAPGAAPGTPATLKVEALPLTTLPGYTAGPVVNNAQTAIPVPADLRAAADLDNYLSIFLNAHGFVPGTGGGGSTGGGSTPMPANLSPVAAAGLDATLTLPTTSVTLTGGGTDPDGSINAYRWAQTGGPVQAQIAAPASATTLVTGLTAVGAYYFSLQVTDNGGSSNTDFVQVTQQAAPASSGGGGGTGLTALTEGASPVENLARVGSDFGAADVAGAYPRGVFTTKRLAANGTGRVVMTLNGLNTGYVAFRPGPDLPLQNGGVAGMRVQGGNVRSSGEGGDAYEGNGAGGSGFSQLRGGYDPADNLHYVFVEYTAAALAQVQDGTAAWTPVNKYLSGGQVLYLKIYLFELSLGVYGLYTEGLS